MTSDAAALYEALVARDPRFDGLFFVGVTSTGIYCRPVCTARTPKRANCRFYEHAVAAESAGFRPCLRCRPELAPGKAPIDEGQRIASLIAYRIDEGALDGGAGLEQLAKEFGWSSRQIRRRVRAELGVSPIELVSTRRLLLAKQLLTETSLPIVEVAFASGFSSVRRFNDAFGGRYGLAPSRFRKSADDSSGPGAAASTFTLQLAYRPPFDWESLLRFLEARAIPGVEQVSDDAYARTVRLGNHRGWLRVRNDPARNALRVELAHSLTPVLPAVLGRLRQLFDLHARPDVIAAWLAQDALLATSVAEHPGLRVPGCFDSFELAVRAVLGQQVSVAAATTLAGRVAEVFGEAIATPQGFLPRTWPTAQRMAKSKPRELSALGILPARADTIVALSDAIASGSILLEPGVRPEPMVELLTALPGIGAWTAQYIAMRALRSPDAFPNGDLALRKRLGGVTPSQAEVLSQPWRPWRSYATVHLWQQAPALRAERKQLAVRRR